MLPLDARFQKSAADLVDARLDLAFAAAAIGCARITLATWGRPTRVALAVMPPALLVIAQGGARIARARTADHAQLRALGASESFTRTTATSEAAILGALAALAGSMFSLTFARATSTPPPGVYSTLLTLLAATVTGAVSAAATVHGHADR